MVDSIDDAERRRRLDALSHALRPLHKALVDVVQADWERTKGRIGGPVQLFQLLTTDPFFLWLHPMSALMAEIDELTDQKEPVAPADAAAVRATLKKLVADHDGDAPPESFVARYLAILQAEPDVVLLHATMRRVADHIA
jgi:hypothetical protein